MALTVLECPDNVCHSHHGGHAVAREEVECNLNAHGADWCERVRSGSTRSRSTASAKPRCPTCSSSWQRRHLDWEFKLSQEPTEVEPTVVDGAIHAKESFLRSNEVQRLFIKELVQGTFAESMQNPLRSMGIRYLD
jgi:hypothetical protein